MKLTGYPGSKHSAKRDATLMHQGWRCHRQSPINVYDNWTNAYSYKGNPVFLLEKSHILERIQLILMAFYILLYVIGNLRLDQCLDNSNYYGYDSLSVFIMLGFRHVLKAMV